MKTILLAATLSIGLPALALAQTPPTATQPPAPAQMQRVDADTFRTMAMSGDALEIQSSRLALERSQNPLVRRFAERMVRDHSRTTQRLTGQSPANAAPQLTPQHAAMLEQLRGLQGREFDRAYIEMQVAAHREAVTLFESYSRSGDDQRLAAFAQETRPHLRQHLRSATNLQRDVMR